MSTLSAQVISPAGKSSPEAAKPQQLVMNSLPDIIGTGATNTEPPAELTVPLSSFEAFYQRMIAEVQIPRPIWQLPAKPQEGLSMNSNPSYPTIRQKKTVKLPRPVLMETFNKPQENSSMRTKTKLRSPSTRRLRSKVLQSASPKPAKKKRKLYSTNLDATEHKPQENSYVKKIPTGANTISSTAVTAKQIYFDVRSNEKIPKPKIR